MTFSKTFEVMWSHVDMNGHVQHTAYSNYATNVRVAFLQSIGVDGDFFNVKRIGPILLREHVEYKREAHLMDQLSINLRVRALSPDGSNWCIEHNVFKDGKLSVRILVEGAWMDLRARKMIAPPDIILRGFQQAERTEDFSENISRRPFLKLSL